MTEIKGWCVSEKARDMKALIQSHKPQTVVEIGVFGGSSLIPQAEAIRDNGFGCIYGIDAWDSKAAIANNGGTEDAVDWWGKEDLAGIYDGFIKALVERDLMRWVRILHTTSQKAAGLFTEIDSLHIDGNHSEIDSVRDVRLYVPKVKVGGWIWFDDAHWSSVKKALVLLGNMAHLVRDYGEWRLYRRKSF